MTNFKELTDLETRATNDTGLSTYQADILNEYIETKKKRQLAKENPFVYFYEDVIKRILNFNFLHTLGEQAYQSASSDALVCLNVTNELQEISSYKTGAWLNNALKFADHIVLHYIQEYCGEVPKEYANTGIEKARYTHLEEKEAKDISVAGSQLKELYDLRNGLEHRTIIKPDGKQELVKPQFNKVRNTTLKLYPDAMSRILKTYRLAFPENIMESLLNEESEVKEN